MSKLDTTKEAISNAFVALGATQTIAEFEDRFAKKAPTPEISPRTDDAGATAADAKQDVAKDMKEAASPPRIGIGATQALTSQALVGASPASKSMTFKRMMSMSLDSDTGAPKAKKKKTSREDVCSDSGDDCASQTKGNAGGSSTDCASHINLGPAGATRTSSRESRVTCGQILSIACTCLHKHMQRIARAIVAFGVCVDIPSPLPGDVVAWAQLRVTVNQ